MADRYLMWTMSTFVVSLFVFTLVSVRWILVLATIALLMIIPAVILKYSFKKSLVPSLIAIVFAAIVFLFSNHTLISTQSVLIDSECEIVGEVTDLGTNAAGDLIKYKVRLIRYGTTAVSSFDRIYINLYCRSDEKFLPGSMVQGTLSFFESPIDYGMGREDRIILSAIQEADLLQFSQRQDGSLSSLLYNLRNSLQKYISYGTEQTQGLLRAVCLGDTDSLDSALNVSLRRIGLTHVTAVSGLHLSFTVLLFNYILIALGLHYRIRYLIDIFIAIIFSALLGFPLSCVRACIMIVLMSFGMVLNLFDDGLTSLSVAAFLITIVNPFAVRDVGFLLSVTATAGILLLSKPIDQFLFCEKIGNSRFVNWIYRKFKGAFSCSVAATAATLPIVLIVFRSVSLIGPFANALLIYPLQWLFMMGILMVLLGWIPGVGVVLGWLCDLLYIIIDFISGILGRIPFANVSQLNLIGIVALLLFIFVVGVGVFDYKVNKCRSTMVLFTLLACFVGTFSFVYETVHSNDDIEVAFINVGQGDCTVISRDHTAVIFDYGGSSKERYNLIEYMKSNGIYTVELLAFTHLHDDHTNGLATLLKNVYVDSIIYPELEFDSLSQMELLYRENANTVENDQCLTVLGNVKVEVVTSALRNQNNSSGNEQCVCYKIIYGNTSVLVTGDLTGESELLLADQIGDLSILKVSHHGSATSTLYPFIKATTPEISVISVGENAYGLPKESVVKRLKTLSNEVYITKEDGNLIFKTDGMIMERIHE